MMRISTFYAVSSTLAMLGLSADSASAGDQIRGNNTPHLNSNPSIGSGGGTKAGKVTIKGVGGNRQIQDQQEQGDANHPYVIGGAYNARTTNNPIPKIKGTPRDPK